MVARRPAEDCAVIVSGQDGGLDFVTHIFCTCLYG
jgi:hypothetical protein